MTLATGQAPEAGATHRFSLDDYNRIIDAGILTEYDNVELIHGEIIDMAPMGDGHSFSILRYNRLLSKLYYDEALVLCQTPVQFPPDSEPEPDFALLRLPLEKYEDRKAQADDILLIIELSDSTLAYDRERKLSLYAEAGVPEFWIVNLRDNVLEVYREPKGVTYGVRLTLLPDEKVTPLFSKTPFDWSQD